MPFSDAQYTIFMHFSLVLAKCSSNSFCPRGLGTFVSKDDYFAAIHHISNIVRRKVHPERTLNSMNLSMNSELVFRVLRSCSNSPTESLLFFSWACCHYTPTSVEFEELQLRLSFDTLYFIIEEYGKNGLIDQAVEVFNKSIYLGCKQTVSVYNSLLFALCEVKIFHKAYTLIRRMIRKGEVPDKRTYTVLVNGWCYSGKMKEATDEVFRLLNNSIEQGYKPFPSFYAHIIKGLCKKGQFDDAFSFFGEMKIKGHAPNRLVYTMLITMCGHAGRFVEAANYLVEMTELGLAPISRCFDIVTDGLKNCGKHDLAKRIEQFEVSLRRV
ncbi:hypothetical protein ES332_A07G109000v1 [Gossypium tomentosum]|uniref:Pentacotripeptide-repeat region of PRORP domain-containing protein n=1 Tax=Gossypium tomentosum TaxID=34277 RepID=A0A5D2PTT0_GOSTO|nr:hypothetical protein ES332_A07G109000v1 [Gossypium tomentosum]